jgi:hypothetical protein
MTADSALKSTPPMSASLIMNAVMFKRATRYPLVTVNCSLLPRPFVVCSLEGPFLIGHLHWTRNNAAMSNLSLTPDRAPTYVPVLERNLSQRSSNVYRSFQNLDGS